MTLSGFVLFVLGALMEMLFLVSAHVSSGEQMVPGSGWLARAFTVERFLMAGLCVVAGGFVGLFEFLGFGHILVYIDTPFVGIVMVVMALAVLAASLMVNLFLPVINEQSILLVQLLVLAGVFLGRERAAWLPAAALTIVPVGVSLALVFWPRAFHPSIKAVLYLWYLLSLLVIPFQNGETVLFHQVNLSWAESCSLGMLGVFLLLNGLFAVRFFLLASSLLRPRNHTLVASIMPALFSDRQVSLPRYLLVVLLLFFLLAGNNYLNLLDRGAAISFCSLIGVQLLGAGLGVSSKNTSP